MSKLCKLLLVNQTVGHPHSGREVGLAIKGYQEGALRGGNVLCLDWISVSILVVISTLVSQDVTVGGNWVRGAWSLCVISYNCM